MKRTKILIAINCLNIGGAPSVVLGHLRGLDTQKFEPWVLTLYNSKPANFLTEVEACVGKGRLVAFQLHKRSLFDIATWVRVYRFLRREQFAAVITHLFLANTLVRAVAIAARVPRIISFEHSQYRDKRSWQISVDRFLARYTYRIVVAHEAIAEFTRTQERLPRELFCVLPNPVTLPIYSETVTEHVRTKWGVPKRDCVFVSVGRFSEEKGQQFLLQAAALLMERTKDFFVIIVGHGALKEALCTQVQDAGLADVCSVIEDPSHAPVAYTLGDVFVLPSLREGESLVTREALLAGLPIIVSDLETLRGLAAGAGIVVPPADPSALATAMMAMMQDPDLRKAYGEVAKTKVMQDATETARALERLLV
jgi:glycosyltransferase involved in cell wall biosynthesis